MTSDNTTHDLTTCYYFSIILMNNTEIRICETTNKEKLESIINIILNHCENQPQWQKDSTIHLDNKLKNYGNNHEKISKELFILYLSIFVSMFVSAQSHAHELEQDSTGNTLKINVNNDSTTLPLPGVTVTITNTPAWISMGTTSSSVGTVEASGRRPASFTFSVGKGSSPEEVLTGTIEARIEASSGDITTISIPVVAKPVLGPCEEIKDGAIVEKDCDDQNECTKDTCNPDTGVCEHEDIPLDICETCKDKKIVPKCDDENLCTTDTCDPNTGDCSYETKDCNDNDQCTVDDCDPETGDCTNKNKCDDDNECTEDICNAETGECTHNLIPLDPCQVCRDKK
ncbi:MAG: hypothetical protein OMM_00581 [Candidatus Magnetoglobus multicellularis str. Araruama]|uniref:Uncharacterized protein n=1 Tax=Candidatus Magnetoglobus multicellularis str. Araruama TaxID=890399 RepID=A0A1V1PGR8_9BACT|nr:MAG: hypothetical protein OMM_00581 [Candidatus Magnetoglobus multicellularis str. Araruama]